MTPSQEPSTPSISAGDPGTDPSGQKEMIRPLEGDRFRFRCHAAIPCFNKCCAKLRLILTPYDILRMKNRLSLTSDEFLDKYAETSLTEHHRFPMVKLKMDATRDRACPFVTTKGCSIYEDRPGACRIYPLGRASAVAAGEGKAREKFFVVSEAHCFGFQEGKTWTLDEWLDHEGVRQYNIMNDQWLEIIGSTKPLVAGDRTQKLQMFFMASFNLDKFRQFIQGSRFFDRFYVEPDLKSQLARDEVALMKFAFQWLKFSLFGEQTLTLK
jgi:Fe-S-cluster containining protein